MRSSLLWSMGALLACGGGVTVTPPVTAPSATTTAAALPTTRPSPVPSTDKRYTLPDLRALAQRASWAELSDHLEDVAPSDRNAEWNALAQQTALGVLTGWANRSPSEGLAAAQALLERYPVLKESKDFMGRRATVGLQAFERCFDRDASFELCAPHLKPFVMADPTDHDLAFRLGKLVPPRARGFHAVPAFAVAIDKKGDARCQDADVRRAVMSGLALAKAGHEDVVAQSIELASNLCFREMRQAIVDSMGTLAPDLFKNTCPFMKSQHVLSSLQTKLCDDATR
jgi:hypothetical protein